MEVTEVRIKLTEDNDDRLRAFCSLTFDDCFVVRDIKIIEGTSGPFIAMPSRKLMFHCGSCGFKNHLRSRYCNQCGKQQPPASQQEAAADSKTRLYADIAHPINSACREKIQTKVIDEFQREVELSKQPGYKSRYEDEFAVGSGKRGRKNSQSQTPRPHHLNKNDSVPSPVSSTPLPGSPGPTGNPSQQSAPADLHGKPLKAEQYSEGIRRTGSGLHAFVGSTNGPSRHGNLAAMDVPSAK